MPVIRLLMPSDCCIAFEVADLWPITLRPEASFFVTFAGLHSVSISISKVKAAWPAFRAGFDHIAAALARST
jgi:hypothetical protein